MANNNHWAVFLSDKANKQLLAEQLLSNKMPAAFEGFNGLQGVLFSAIAINELIEKEERYQLVEVAKATSQQLRFLSGGEQKKALLNYLLAKQPGFIIADNPLDNLDTTSQSSLLAMLQQAAATIPIIQLINRAKDCLPFIKNGVSVNDDNTIVHQSNIAEYIYRQQVKNTPVFFGTTPVTDYQYAMVNSPLIQFKNVTVKYQDKTIVNNICWQINTGEFWQLIGPNGSGKTTLLSLITGDNPKGYGQDLILFGKRKGSGESVWSIKQKIGYFTASMTDLFNKYCSVEQMVISGFFDSVGLYTKPSGRQLKIAGEWLLLIGIGQLKHTAFYKLSLGQQRLIMIVRAMVKHPPLLILDEPAAGLDDDNAAIVTALINKIATESNTAIVYVSHRTEEGLSPKFIFELAPGKEGSTGCIFS